MSESQARVVVVEPAARWPSFALGELWTQRELVYFLTWRDVKVRYKQTLFGVAWAILQPLLTMLVFSLFFGRLAKVPSQGVPYPLFALAALVPWTFFANGLTQSANSVVLSQNLITKVYFPRLAIPLATVLAGALDFVLAFVLLLVFLIAYGIAPKASWIGIVPFSLLAFAATLGVGLWLAALNVLYRDVRYAVPFLAQLWLFATPIAYPSSLLGEPWRTVYALNPMVAVVDGFRWALLGTPAPSSASVAVSCAVTLVLLVTGSLFFRRTEQSFADVV
ncbi:MAG: phosphate ABC transporter permease [Gemmatimonadetes bacterium]|nr:MAG: phosphate ABC transporter permease [Gemmatimonadota bacterium]